MVDNIREKKEKKKEIKKWQMILGRKKKKRK